MPSSQARRRIGSAFSLSLRATLITGFGLVLGLWGFVGVLAIMEERTTIDDFNKLLTVDIQAQDIGQDAMVSMMKARRHEKDFLLMYREFGFGEARSRYVTLLQADLADTRQSLAQMNRLIGNPETKHQIRLATQSIDNYENAFLEVVARHGQLGFIDAGLEGQFRDSAHQIEALLDPARDGKLIIDLLSVRRHEKDYLARARDVDIRLIRQAVAQLRTNIASAPMAAERRSRLASLVEAYRSQIEKYMSIHEQIALEKRRYLAAVQSIEPHLDKLLGDALAESRVVQDAIRTKATQTEAIIVVTGLGAIILGVIVAGLVSWRITGSIRTIMTFAERIATGDLRTRATSTGRDEFSVLGRSLNHMADALQEAARLQEQRTAELEQRVLARTAELAESEERFRHLADLSSDWYWEQDENFRFTKIASAQANRPGADTDRYLGMTRWELASEAAPEEWARHKAALNAHQKFTDFEYPVQLGSDDPKWCSVSGEPQFDSSDRFTGYRGVGKDITERKRIEERIRHLSLHDVLTGLPNRALLQDRLTQALTYAARNPHTVWVVFIDLDGFKGVNDTLGHKAGDVVLNAVARRLQSVIRESDTVARLGGDEFVLVLAERTESKEISGAVARIMKQLAQPLSVEGQEVRLGCSMGVAAYPQDGMDANTLIEHADAAMYHAKQSGRNNAQFYNASMTETGRSGGDHDNEKGL